MVIKLIIVLGTFLTMTKIVCYIIFFVHLFHHNNTIAIGILTPPIIKQRNRVNAISMFGQFAAWLMDVLYIVLAGLLSFFHDVDKLREIASLLKSFEFLLIPLLEVFTSVPIRKFLMDTGKMS